MRKLFSADLEKMLLKAALSSASATRILGKLSIDHFATEVASEAFERVTMLLRKRGRLMSWKALCYDTGLSDATRDALKAFRTKPPTSTEDITELIRSADEYRAVRAVNEFGRSLHAKLSNPDLEVDDLRDFVASATATLATGSGSLKARHIGVGDNSSSMVRKILAGDLSRYIPTGFKGYDEENKGIELGSLLMIASPSGNGKSVMVQTLSRNFALAGAKVCIVPLEMDDMSLMRRELAMQMQIELTKLIDPTKSMTRKERESVYEAYKKLSGKIAKAGGKLTILSSDSDLTLEGILSYCKAHAYNVVVIDYVGLLAGADGDDQAKALSRMARMAKLWATANKAIVVMAAQLGDDGTVRYSRALKEHASQMWQWMFDGRSRELGVITIHQTKARMNSDRPFMLRFDPPTMTMRDPTADERKSAREDTKGSDTAPKGKRAVYPKKKKVKDIDEYLGDL